MASIAFSTLASIAEKSRKNASSLPQKIDAAPLWRGLGFMLMGQRFVAPMGQVSEMLEVPSVSTRLPGVQAWVLGLSNVRGRLLPLFDLAMFMGGETGHQRKQHRVLVLEAEDLFSGCVVESALGMQQFELERYDKHAQMDAHKELKKYVSGAFKDKQDASWFVFDFLKLAGDQRFANVSLV